MTNVRCSVAAEMNLSETAFVRDGIWAESFLEDRQRRSLRENCSMERDRVECASWADAPTCWIDLDTIRMLS